VRETGIVPGILWTPAQQERPVPLVLMGTGGVAISELTDNYCWAGALLGWRRCSSVHRRPLHGDRVPVQLDRRQYQERMAAMGVDKVTDGMVGDWRTTLDALSHLDTIDANRIAYIGFSMGTRFGLPYVAAAGDRLRCAVLGKNGISQTSAMPTSVNMAQRFKQGCAHH